MGIENKELVKFNDARYQIGSAEISCRPSELSQQLLGKEVYIRYRPPTADEIYVLPAATQTRKSVCLLVDAPPIPHSSLGATEIHDSS